MSRTKGSGAPVRFVNGTWEYRCDDCRRKGGGGCFWPLTPECWDTVKGMTRCRACWAERRNAQNRARWASDPVWAEAKRVENREQRRARSRAWYRRLKADPAKLAAFYERRRVANRGASVRYRARQAVAA